MNNGAKQVTPTIEAIAEHVLAERMRELNDEIFTLMEAHGPNSRPVWRFWADYDTISWIREGLLSNGNFKTALELIMDLDTAVRDPILEAMQKAGLQEAVEATGLVKYAPKQESLILNPRVKRAVDEVRDTTEDRVLFIENALVAVRGRVDGEGYEIHVAHESRKIV